MVSYVTLKDKHITDVKEVRSPKWKGKTKRKFKKKKGEAKPEEKKNDSFSNI